MNRVRFEDNLGNHKRTVSATSMARAIDKIGGKLPKGWIAIPEDTGAEVDSAPITLEQARIVVESAGFAVVPKGESEYD